LSCRWRSTPSFGDQGEMAVATTEDPLKQAKKVLEEYGLSKAEEVRGLLRDARAAAVGRGDSQGEADAIRVLIDIHLAKKEHQEAAQLAQEAAGVFQDKSKKATQMLLLAQIHLNREGGWSEAMTVLGQAQALYKEAGDKDGEVEAMGMMAQIHLEGGDTEAALRVAREALAVSPDAATAMHTIAQVQLARGDVSAAIQQATEMLAVCKDKANKAGHASASLVLANAILSMDATSMEGLNCGREALSLFQEVGDTYGTQSALHTLANGYFSRCDLEEGLKCAREALALFRQTGDQNSEAVLKATVEQARAMTQEYRKTAPKRPFVLPPSAISARLCGPQACPVAESAVPKEVLDQVVAGRKYWGNPTQVEPDPTVDAADRAPNHTVIWAMNMSDNSATQVCVEFGDLLACMAKGDVAKIPIVVLTCGVFGRQVGEHQVATMTNVAAATMWGMARTARQEVPSVIIQLLDFSEAMTAAEIPRTIRPALPESAYYHKARWEPQIAAVPSLFRRDLRRDNLTGGGPGGQESAAKNTSAKFLRKTFSWTGPSHKMDFCWYRQEWRACGPAFEDVGAMPPPPPCRAMRSC